MGKRTRGKSTNKVELIEQSDDQIESNGQQSSEEDDDLGETLPPGYRFSDDPPIKKVSNTQYKDHRLVRNIIYFN